MQQNTSELCSNCTTEAKCRRRDFSEQAWTVLVLWNEVKTAAVDQAICDDCYNELREVLIDRAEDIQAALAEPAPKKPTAATKRPAPGRQKVRKAG